MVAPWTTVKYRLYGARTIQTANAGSVAPAAAVNTLNHLYPNSTPALYAQRSSAQLADTPMLSRFSDIDDLWVSVASAEQVPTVKRQLTQLLRERHGTPDDEPDDFRMRDRDAPWL